MTVSPDRDLPSVLVDEFQRNGIVVIENVFSDAELERFGEAVDDAVAAETGDDRRPLESRSRYEQSFRQCLNLWTRYPNVCAFSTDPRPAAIAARLLGTESVRLWHDQALYKESGGRQTDPHQDHPYWPIIEHDLVTAWVPLDGSTVENGAMSYWPGSHREGLHRFVNIFGDEEPEDIGTTAALADIQPMTIEVPRGAIAFHHALTAHRANPNKSATTRRVHTMIYMADGCHRSEDGRGHPAVDFDGIPPGGEISGTLTPIVWPPDEQGVRVPDGAAEYLREFIRQRRAQRP